MSVSSQPDLRRERSSPYAIAAAVAVVAIVGVVIPLLIAQHYGATGIPRDDDWSYLRALFHWVDTGRLDFNNWVSMILLGQLVLAAPVVEVFGRDIAAVQVLTGLLGFVGLLAVLWLGVLVTGRLSVATFIAVLVAIGPLWGELSVSFMTDVPAFTFSLLACVLGARALTRERISLPFLVAALVAGFIGFTIRQYAVVPLVALTLVGAWTLGRARSDRRWWTFMFIASGVAIASILVFAYWRTIPNLKPFEPGFPDGHSLRVTLYKGTGMLRLIGLLLTPAIVLAGPVRIVRRSWAASREAVIVLAFGAFAVLLYTATAAPRIAFAGNFVVPDGILGNTVLGGSPRPDILPTGGWNLLVAVGTLAAMVLVVAVVPAAVSLVRRIRGRDGDPSDPVDPVDPVLVLLGLVVGGYTAAYALAAFSGLPLSDRYVLPVVPLLAVLLLRRPRLAVVASDAAPDAAPAPAQVDRAHDRRQLGLAIGTLVAVGLVGLLYTVDSASFDGTRWKVAEDAVELGWKPEQIRGGFEWTNFHSRVPHGEHRNRPACVSVLLDPESGTNAGNVIAIRYYHSPFIDAVPIVAIRTNEPCTHGDG